MKRLFQSFGHGFRGIGATFKSEPNFRIHCFSAVLAVIFGFVYKISMIEWIAVIFAIGIVLAAEAMNTGLEALADAVHPEEHRLVGKAKDAAASAVLITSIAAATVGGIVFAPKIFLPLWNWLSQMIESLNHPPGFTNL